MACAFDRLEGDAQIRLPVGKHLFVLCGRNLALLLLQVFACPQGKSKCAKLAIATPGLSNPKKRGGKILNSFVGMSVRGKKTLPDCSLVSRNVVDREATALVKPLCLYVDTPYI